MSNMSTSRAFQSPGVDSFAASDFIDFIDSLQALETTTTDFLSEEKAWNPSETAPYRNEAQCRSVEQRLEITTRLEKEFQELDAHYGWVLASDYALVAKVIAQRSGEEMDAKDWMKNAYESYVKMRSELAALREGLCNLAENARKNVQSREGKTA